jgi:hypothetical protein
MRVDSRPPPVSSCLLRSRPHSCLSGIPDARQSLAKHVPDLSITGLQRYLVGRYSKGRKGKALNNYIHTVQIYGRYKQTDAYKKLAFFPEDRTRKSIMSDGEIEAFLNLPPDP